MPRPLLLRFPAGRWRPPEGRPDGEELRLHVRTYTPVARGWWAVKGWRVYPGDQESQAGVWLVPTPALRDEIDRWKAGR